MTNIYGNIAGYHTPKKTEKNLNLIREGTQFEWFCVSWKNDLVDSISYKDIEVYLPNADKTVEEDEEFNTYQVIDAETREQLFVSEDLNKTIRFLKDMCFV